LIGYQVSLTFGVATLATMIGGNVVLRYGGARATQLSKAIAVCTMLLLFKKVHCTHYKKTGLSYGKC
jgi:hypothetical protein